MGSAILCYSFPLQLAWTSLFCLHKNVAVMKSWGSIDKCHFDLEVPDPMGLRCLIPQSWAGPAILVTVQYSVWLNRCAAGCPGGFMLQECIIPSHPLQQEKLNELYMEGKSRGHRGWSDLPWGHLLSLSWCGQGPWWLVELWYPFVC